MFNVETIKDNQVKVVANYLETNASDALRAKIEAGLSGENASFYSVDSCFQYITGEARKLAVNNCAMVDDSTVFGWAVHYYEDAVANVIEEAKKKAEEKAKKKAEAKKAPVTVKPVSSTSLSSLQSGGIPKVEVGNLTPSSVVLPRDSKGKSIKKPVDENQVSIFDLFGACEAPKNAAQDDEQISMDTLSTDLPVEEQAEDLPDEHNPFDDLLAEQGIVDEDNNLIVDTDESSNDTPLPFGDGDVVPAEQVISRDVVRDFNADILTREVPENIYALPLDDEAEDVEIFYDDKDNFDVFIESMPMPDCIGEEEDF